MKRGSVAILGGHVVDPRSGIDQVADIVIAGGKVVETAGGRRGPPLRDHRVINATGCFVFPGLIDVHVHLRTPGEEEKEDPASGGQAAARGGFTTICCMPNTRPALDSPGVIEQLLERCERECSVRVVPFGAMTKGNLGEELTDFAALKRAGAMALSDDAYPVQDSSLAMQGFQQAAVENVLLALHSEDLGLAGSSGQWSLASESSPLAPRPSSLVLAEEVMVARNLLLAAGAGARLHLCHLSTARGVGLLRWAKEEGVAVPRRARDGERSRTVTAEATPHHLLLNDGAVSELGAVAKVKPPLRAEGERLALLKAVKEGVVDVIATDHAPHLWDEKRRGFEEAPGGIVGLETALALVNTHLGLGMGEIVSLMSTRPAEILGLADRGHLGPGAWGDVVIFDPQRSWRIEGKRFFSKAKFTPFEGWEVRGEVVATIVGGEIVYESGSP